LSDVNLATDGIQCDAVRKSIWAREIAAVPLSSSGQWRATAADARAEAKRRLKIQRDDSRDQPFATSPVFASFESVVLTLARPRPVAAATSPAVIASPLDRAASTALLI
jgi:hypothetical protein